MASLFLIVRRLAAWRAGLALQKEAATSSAASAKAAAKAAPATADSNAGATAKGAKDGKDESTGGDSVRETGARKRKASAA